MDSCVLREKTEETPYFLFYKASTMIPSLKKQQLGGGGGCCLTEEDFEFWIMKQEKRSKEQMQRYNQD